MFKKMWCIFALCFLAAKAQSKTDTKSPLSVNDSKTAKVEPAKISALYIGDLLRTKPKEEVLEAAGSFHTPIILDRAYASEASVPDSTHLYKSHGGHEYPEHVYTSPESRSSSPSSVKRIGNQARSVSQIPVLNVRGHLLTLKPVRVVAADPLTAPRSHEASHHSKDDCSKSRDDSYSSEEAHYAPEQQTYRRAKQVAPELEYRNPPSSYDDDDRPDVYSDSGPSDSSTYDSKSIATNTNSKSHSSGSYSKSKSTSSSNPSRSKTQPVPTAVLKLKEYEKHSGPPRARLYKVTEPPSPSAYSDSAEGDYPSSNNERDYKSEVRESSPYTQHSSSGGKRPRKYPVRGERTQYSTAEQKEKPKQGAPSHYEQDSYEQNSYPTAGEQRYREQSNPSSNYHEEEYAQRPDTRVKEPQKTPYQSYQAPASTIDYQTDQPRKPLLQKKFHGSQYKRPSSEGREYIGYRSREPATTEYSSRPREHQIQSSRPKKESPHSSYEYYPTQDASTESSSSAQAYERNHPAPRPLEEKQISQYAYEVSPQQSGSKHSDHHGSHKKHYKEPSRYARSPGKPVAVDGRSALLPTAEAQRVVLVSRESKPTVSRSVSYSANKHSEDPADILKEYQPLHQSQGRQISDPEYQASYKPHNSEFPASYANDQHHNAEEQHPSLSYQRPHSYSPAHVGREPQSYSSRPGAREPQSYSSRPGAREPQSYSSRPGVREPQSYSSRPGVSKPKSYSSGPSHSQTQSYSGPGGHQQHREPYGEDQYDEDDDEESGGSYGHGTGGGEGGSSQKGGKDHHYISNIEGYKDSYAPHEPLKIDEEFFRKYGISPTAKVIVASAKKPNMFVADGTNIKEGEYFGINTDSGGQSPGPSYGPNSGPPAEDESYDPEYKDNYSKEESYNESPEEPGHLKEMPGSFDDLVDANPKFLRNLPQMMKGDDSFFKMDSSDTSFDDIELPKEKRGYVVSQGPREIVQQHGDGVSRIIFNIPQDDSFAESSSQFKERSDQEAERILAEAATEVIANILKTDS